jgi:F-type H+-transporting ATPase subunit b|tara:strand:+ start:8374 stop:8868 length:495 start_codon:yes stop_codon:yes gene_type:complete
MPQFDITTFASQIFWLIISFSLVFLFVWRIGLPRIANTLENRQKKIGDDLAKANELAEQTDEVMAAYEEKLADARASAHEELHSATVKAVEKSDEQNSLLAEKLAANAAAARDRIADESAAAINNIVGVSEEITQQAVERLIGKTPDANSVKSAVNKAVQDQTS